MTKIQVTFWSSDQPGAIKCARARCKTCLFIHSMEKISGPSDLLRLLITLRIPPPIFTSWETRRRLSDRFREHLRYVERKGRHASKPVAKHFNLPILSLEHMAVFGLSLQLGNSESLEHKFIFQIGSLNPNGINERFSFNLSILVFLVTMFPPTASSIFCIQTYISQNSSIYFEESLTLETSALKLYAG